MLAKFQNYGLHIWGSVVLVLNVMQFRKQVIYKYVWKQNHEVLGKGLLSKNT